MAKKQKLADVVIAKLQQRIAGGTWKKGDRIPTEPELMELFGVGRSTIREAIKTLANAGVLHVQQGSGTFVNAYKQTSETLDQRLRRAAHRELNYVRIMLEKEIVRLAIKHRTKKDMVQLAAALAARQEAIASKDYAAAMEADLLFHTRLAIASHNAVLADLYVSFTEVLRSYFPKRDAGSVARFRKTHPLHEQLLQAVADRQEQDALFCIDTLLLDKF
jgi:DNA-binding FadR family transcriptional regulator